MSGGLGGLGGDGSDTGLPRAPGASEPGRPLASPTPSQPASAPPEPRRVDRPAFTGLAPDVGFTGAPFIDPRTRPAASWSRRVVATLIDSALVFGLVSVLVFAMLVAGVLAIGDESRSDEGVLYGAIVGLVLTVPLFLCALPAWMAWTDGRTPGKAITGIRVVRLDGQRTTFASAFVRETLVKTLLIGAVGGTFVFVPIANAVWPLFDPNDKALHDHLVKTRVVRD